jgi:hypothetical protein
MRTCIADDDGGTAMSDDKALSFIPQIQAAHDKAVDAQQKGYSQSLEAAIDAGDLLERAKEAVGTGGWGKWRAKHLPDIPQTTASLYMRLAKNKERFGERAISNAVANLRDEGKLSIRSAAALLGKQRPRGTPKPKSKGDEGVGAEWLKALAPDELVTWLQKLHAHDTEYLQDVSAKLAKALMPPPAAPVTAAASAPIAAGMERRV